MAGKTRHKARIAALQALYESDVSHHDPLVSVARLCDEESLTETQSEFARGLVAGVLEQRDEIDALIRRSARQWPLEQLSAIDRNILRLAIREILMNNVAPIGAVINEAVELAKQYGSDSAPRFVNGVLGTLAGREQEVRRQFQPAA